MQKDKFEKIVLAAIGLIIAIILLVVFIFAPSFKKLSIVRQKINKQQQKVITAEEDVSNLPRMKKNLAQLAAENLQYEGQIPPATPDWLLGKLNSLAEDIGLSFDKIEPRGSIMKIGPYNLQSYQVALKTDYHRLGKFIDFFEQSSGFLRVLQLSIVGDNRSTNNHDVKITIGAFVLMPEEKEKKR